MMSGRRRKKIWSMSSTLQRLSTEVRLRHLDISIATHIHINIGCYSWRGHGESYHRSAASFLLRGLHALKTGIALTNLLLVLVLHPEAQQRAQNEIDFVVGRQRLPTIEDRANLPYIEAMCREVLRWRLVTQLGMLKCDYFRSSSYLLNYVL